MQLGRQAEQVTAGVPGWLARLRSIILTEVLTEAGDLPAAECVCTARRRQQLLREVRQALGAARTRTAVERGAAMSLATAAEYALILTDPDLPQSGPSRADTLSSRERELVTPGRPGPHQRPDRRPAVHQHRHGQLGPGPHRGRDRLPSPRRPDPPGPGHGPGLANPAACGSSHPGRRCRQRGSPTPTPCPPPAPTVRKRIRNSEVIGAVNINRRA
jgi:hypothetical protein